MCGRVGSASSRRVGEWWGANVQKDDARVASKGGVAGGEADRDRRASEGTDAWRARAGGSDEHVPGWDPGAQIRGEASSPCGNWGTPSTSFQGLTIRRTERMPPK